jgi:Secretion system C-terminal sorting domain
MESTSISDIPTHLLSVAQSWWANLNPPWKQTFDEAGYTTSSKFYKYCCQYIAECLQNENLKKVYMQQYTTSHVNGRNGSGLRLTLFLPIIGAFLWGSLSLQAQNWSTATPPSGVNVNMSGVGYNGSQFIAAGSDLKYITSTDGITWTDGGAMASVTPNTATIFQISWISFLNLWVASSNVDLFTDSKIFTSPNGTTWTPRPTGLNSATANRFDDNGSLVIAGAGGSRILKSTNGTTWTIQDISAVWGSNISVQGVIYVNNQWVIVGGSGRIATSPNGTNWTLRTSPSSSLLRTIAYGNGRYVIIGPSNTALWSTDAITWNSVSMGIAQSFTGLTFVNGSFVAVGTSGAIASSSNGSAWTVNNSNTSSALNNVIANGNTGTSTVVAVGGVTPTPILRYLTASALPLELTSFSAKANESEKSIELKWTSENERNFSHFEVENSADGKQYEAIGKVMGQGTTSGTHTYEFTDTKPQSGINYYRLRQVDIDGMENYSPVRSVKLGSGSSATLSPNPIQEGNNANLIFDSNDENDLTIEIFNTLGQVVVQQQATVSKGINPIQLEILTLPKGVYTLSTRVGTESGQSQQFIIQ